jgi:Flp pilus assembly CpaF family ATPase
MLKLKSVYQTSLDDNMHRDFDADYLTRSLKLRSILYIKIQDLLVNSNLSQNAVSLRNSLEQIESQDSFDSIESFYKQKSQKTMIFADLIDKIFANPYAYGLNLDFAPSSQDIEWTKTLLIHDLLYYGPVTLVALARILVKEDFYHDNPLVLYMNRVLDHTKVSELRINKVDEIFVDVGNDTVAWKIPFINEEHLEIVIKRMISESNILNNSSIKINAACPIADFEHPCGYIRGSAVIPPAAEKAFFTLRLHPDKAYTLNNLMSFGMLDEKMKRLFIALQQAGTTIAIAGTMGSGKTTLLSALAEYWPNKGRKATIEDTPELKPVVADLVKMRTIENDIGDEISVTKLTKACKRHSVRYVILSEARDGSAWEILQLSQSILGSIMTFHYTLRSDYHLADQALNTLVALCKQNDLAPKNNDIKHLVADMVQILVLVEQSLIDNVRRIKKVYFVKGFDEANGGSFKAIEIFSYNEKNNQFEFANHCEELQEYLNSKGVDYKF